VHERFAAKPVILSEGDPGTAAGQVRILLLQNLSLPAQNEILPSFVGQDDIFWQQIVPAPCQIQDY
jgi:hypothetical protein